MVQEKMFAEKMFAEKLFADSLLETSSAQRSRRSWTTLTSFGLEALVVGLLLLLPILKTAGLPAARTLSTPVSLGRPAGDAPAPRPHTASAPPPHSNMMNARLVAPGHVLPLISMAPDDPMSAPSAPIGDVGFPIGDRLGVATVLTSGHNVVLPPPPQPVTRAIRTSSMQEGNLIRRVQPLYPSLARGARIQGPVVLAAVISKAGTIENLQVLSGHPMLVPAAIDAVRQWRYRPYILNSEPVEVETQITVNFTLGGG